MPTLIVQHKVRDFDAWRPAYDDHGPVRSRYGVEEASLHRNADDPNDVVIIFRVGDLDRAREFAGSQDLREAMEQAGVVSAPTVWFLEDA